MALYREGKAAMAADGTVTGTGTKWQSSLSLIRPGATIMFLSSPIQMAVVNKVVSDTEIKAITTKGAVVASSDYAILLSDSLTVDGLAQDVAETLRYYQSQETVIADAVEFFKNFDFDSLQNLANQIKANSEAASASATAAAASESSAKTSETNAKASETAAKISETNTKASETAAKTSETNAKASETAAKTSETNAKSSENNAKTSETNTKASETSAKTSEINAKESETASKTSETNAKASETAAKTSETNAKVSEVAAEAARDQVHQIINNAGEQSTLVVLAQPTGAGKSGLLHGGVVQDLQNFLSFDMFPHLIDNTGVEDAHDGMKYVCELATSLGIPVIQKTGKFRLGRGDGSGSIPYSYNFDLGGAELIIDPSFTTYDGFTATNPVAPTIHDSSSDLVGLINASTSLVAQSAVINGLVNNTDYDGQTLFMRSEETKLYKARGEDVYWLHACRLSHYGRMDNTFKYSTASVAEVITMPGRNAITEVHLPDLDFSENVSALQVFKFKYCTGYRIKGGRVKLRNANNTHQTAIVSVQYSDDVEVDAFSDVHPQYGWNGATTGQTIYTNYTFNFYMVKNFRMKNCYAQGYGWGVVGGGYSWGLYFYNCDLNRYDLHEAAFDYALIDKCRIGNYGVVGTFCCSLWIRDSKFVFGNQTQPEIANSNYHNCLVGSRPDYGGWADGNLYIENCEIDGYLLDSSGIKPGIAMFKSMVSADAAIDTDTSYAVTPRFWRDIEIDGLRFNRNGPNVQSLIWNSSPERIMYAPRSIKLRDCDFNNTDILNIQLERFTPDPGSDNTSGPLAVQHHPYIELENVENVVGIAMPAAANTSYWNPQVVLKGFKNTKAGMAKPYFATAHRGKYTIDASCDIKQFATAYGGIHSSLGVVVKFNGATIGDGVSTPLVVGAAGAYVDSWSACGTTFIGGYSASSPTSDNLLIARYVKMSSCLLLDSSFSTINTIKLNGSSIQKDADTAVNIYVQNGAVIELAHNADSTTTMGQIVATTTGTHVIPVYSTDVTPTPRFSRISMGLRGNQSLISYIRTTADNIPTVSMIVK
jgi:uncharacterized coiled-coil DUF342 family protein